MAIPQEVGGAYPKGYCMGNSMYFQCLFKPVKGRNLSIPSFHCYWRAPPLGLWRALSATAFS